MTKDVLISVSGIQFAEAQEEMPVEVITAGEYYKKNDKHYVLYNEKLEGYEGSAKNIYHIGKNYMELTKKGIVNVHMVFEEGKKNLTSYSTPYGNILIGIDTRHVNVEEEEEKLEVHIDYTLEVNYAYLADCKIAMKVTGRVRDKDETGILKGEEERTDEGKKSDHSGSGAGNQIPAGNQGAAQGDAGDCR